MNTRKSLRVWIGPVFLALHPFWTLLPKPCLHRPPQWGFSLYWLWFEFAVIKNAGALTPKGPAHE